jgi:hypothetical protein
MANGAMVGMRRGVPALDVRKGSMTRRSLSVHSGLGHGEAGTTAQPGQSENRSGEPPPAGSAHRTESMPAPWRPARPLAAPRRRESLPFEAAS